MKASELRVGNWIHHEGVGDRCVDLITMRQICTLRDGEATNISPITLTTEWLSRFGFVRIERRSETIYANGGFHLVPQGKGFIFKVVDQIVNYTTIRYVHTLQNLHFSLCGVELQPVTTPQHS